MLIWFLIIFTPDGHWPIIPQGHNMHRCLQAAAREHARRKLDTTCVARRGPVTANPDGDTIQVLTEQF